MLVTIQVIKITSHSSNCYVKIFIEILTLLLPFWNYWWSLKSDWLSAVQFIHKSHFFCSKSHLLPNQWKGTQTRQTIRFQGFLKVILLKLQDCDRQSIRWRICNFCWQNSFLFPNQPLNLISYSFWETAMKHLYWLKSCI